MTNGSVAGVAGTTMGIIGMGIGIGILAHTARNVARMTDDMYSPRRNMRRPKKYYSPRMKYPQLKVNRTYRPKTRSYRRRRSYRYYY